MLRKESVNRTTLELLKRLMGDPSLGDFFLVGGTALALQIGHRLSIDLDLFTIRDFDAIDMLTKLECHYGFRQNFQDENMLKGEIDRVKVDLISHAYPLHKPLTVVEGVRMASLQDIAAMKLNAIIGNGPRLKDFIDIAYLSSSVSFFEMLGAYQEKYSSRNAVMALKAVNFYDDINLREKVKVLDTNYSWSRVRRRLDTMTKNPKKLFPPLRTHKNKNRGTS